MKIRLELILGAVLFVAAFAVLYLAANVINPPAAGVLVALEDIAAGEILGAEMARLEEVSVPDPSLLITEEDLAQFAAAVAIEDIHQGELLQKASFVAAGNPAAQNRTAIGMGDPGMAAFVIPVNQGSAPPGIRRGDLVDVILGIGGDIQMLGQVLPDSGKSESEIPGNVTDSAEAESGEEMGPGPVDPSEPDEPDVSGEAGGSSAWEPPGPVEAQPAQSDGVVLLPIAKALVRCARVL